MGTSYLLMLYTLELDNTVKLSIGVRPAHVMQHNASFFAVAI